MLIALAAATMLMVPADQVPATAKGLRISGALCPATGMTQARLLRPQDLRGDAGARTLGSLPRANMEFTVSRDVGGCNLPAVVREDVQGDGRFARGR